ncbi:MAG: hypothetical protein QM703_25120 [Gemmatales bacterium]
MKSLCIKILQRFWPAWVALALVTFVLASIMEPSPRMKEDMFYPLGKKDFSPGFTLRSNDGRYLAVIGSSRYSWKKMYLIDTVARQELFNIAGDFGDVIFDSTNRLLFTRHFESQIDTVPLEEELMRWDPVAKTQEVLHSFRLPSRKSLEIELHDEPLRYPPREKAWNSGHWSVLSPDVRFWVIPRCDERYHWYELIDLTTGRNIGRLQLPDMLNDEGVVKVIGMHFIEDASLLVVKTWHRVENQEHYQLHWLEADTGKVLGTMPLPTNISEWLFADGKMLVAKAIEEKSGPTYRQKIYVITWRDSALKQLELDEIRPDLQERQGYVPAEYVTPDASIQCNVDPVSHSLIVSWNYGFSVIRRRGSMYSLDRGDFHLPDIHYGVRDLNTGEVVRRGLVPFPKNSDKTGWKRDFVYLKTVLPGPVLVCYRAKQNPEGTLEQWLDWLQQKFDLERTTINETLHFVDGMTGQVQTTIRQIAGVNDITLSPDQKAISITTSNHYRYLYDYPLHKPWLLIVAWAFGVAACITLLTESFRWWRRRKLVSTHHTPL